MVFHIKLFKIEKLYGSAYNIRKKSVFLQTKSYNFMKTRLSLCVKELRKKYGLTQEELAYRSGVSLFFVRELEQGKTSQRMDMVNKVLNLFDYELAPQKREHA